MKLSELKQVGIRLRLGVLSADHLKEVANSALNSGIYSPSLAEVATDPNPSLSSIRPLFEKALFELGISPKESEMGDPRKGNPIFEHKDFAHEQLILGEPTLVTHVAHCRFEDCELILNCPARGLSIGDCSFRNCTVRAKKKQSNHQFFTSTFESCVFIGRFSGCEFGFRIALGGETRGTIKDCDFSRSILEWVTFNNCEIASIRLPTWPHFTILDPSITARHFPSDMDCPEIKALRDVAAQQAEITKGLTCYAPALAKKSRYGLDELHKMLAQIPGVML